MNKLRQSKNKINVVSQVKTKLPPPQNTPYITAKADSGASNHYWRPQDTTALSSIKKDNTTTVRLPDLTTIASTKAGTINFQTTTLSPKATKAHVLPNLQNASLISLGQLADDACITILEDHQIEIYKKDNPQLRGPKHYQTHLQPENKILSGPRNIIDGLWDLQIPVAEKTMLIQTQGKSANAIIRKNQTKTDLAKYLHACAGFPPISTFVKAINKGHFMTWPGIKSVSFTKNLPKSIPSLKGHLDQERKHIQTTKQNEPNAEQHEFFQPLHYKTSKHMQRLLLS
jgi:hypothetical protein